MIDLVCYRRLGHNEADEPAATQPLMYQAIRKHPPARKLYADKLVGRGRADARPKRQRSMEQYREALDEGATGARVARPDRQQVHGGLVALPGRRLAETGAHRGRPARRLRALGGADLQYPADFTLHPRVAQVIVNRAKMLARRACRSTGAAPRSWPTHRSLEDGFPVRLVGQDSGRGTFFHRHAVLHDQNSGSHLHSAAAHRRPVSRTFSVIDSVLSEEAVHGLRIRLLDHRAADCSMIWEGQFGDFVNGAQVIIDQFISSGEAKWGRLCGLTLFLPHGYEGQGPEHSSARLERFLQLCAENNMQVCVPSTPAQMFHMLRRQMLRRFRKPLIVMTPKSLLRHELSVSALRELDQRALRHRHRRDR